MALFVKRSFLILSRHDFMKKISLNNVKNISASPVNYFKEIHEVESGDTLTIYGEVKDSPRKPYLLKHSNPHEACPLCRLNLRLHYTDVLILSQFVGSNGVPIHRRFTGLCPRQQRLVVKLVDLAQKAGLMPMKTVPPTEDEIMLSKPFDWSNYKRYFETNKEIKWKEMMLKEKYYYIKPEKRKFTLLNVLSHINEHKH